MGPSPVVGSAPWISFAVIWTCWWPNTSTWKAEAAMSPFLRAHRCSLNRCLRDLPVCPMYKEDRRALSNGDVAASVLAEDAITVGYGIDLSKAKVLSSNPHRTCLHAWEMAHPANENKLNREWGNLRRCIRHSWAETYHINVWHINVFHGRRHQLSSMQY